MIQNVTRSAFIAAALGAVVGCNSDLNYRAYLPLALTDGSESMLRTREFGECSVEAFPISDSLAAELTATGIAFFASRTAVLSFQPVKGIRVPYSPRQSGPLLDHAFSEQVRRKVSWSLRCLSEDPDMQEAYKVALDSPGDCILRPTPMRSFKRRLSSSLRSSPSLYRRDRKTYFLTRTLGPSRTSLRFSHRISRH